MNVIKYHYSPILKCVLNYFTHSLSFHLYCLIWYLLHACYCLFILGLFFFHFCYCPRFTRAGTLGSPNPLILYCCFLIPAVALGANEICQTAADCKCEPDMIVTCHHNSCHCHQEGHRCNPDHADHCSHFCTTGQTASCDLHFCHCDGVAPTSHHGHQ